MTKERFESKIRELLPRVNESALRTFTEYAEAMDKDGVEATADFFDRLYVELSLAKRDYGMEVAEALFNYGETFTLNPFEFRGAARLLKGGLSLEQIAEISVTDGCDPTVAESDETQAVLAKLQEETAGLDSEKGIVPEQQIQQTM